MRDIIEILVEEHENITDKINEIELSCLLFMEKNEIDIQEFRNYVKFIREYADGTHHKKEEDILFREMLKKLGRTAENLIKNGMLVEHDLARLYVMELSNALDRYEEKREDLDKLCIIGNAMSYVYLLRRHIEKENGVVYPYAQRNLEPELMLELSLEAEKFDENK